MALRVSFGLSGTVCGVNQDIGVKKLHVKETSGS